MTGNRMRRAGERGSSAVEFSLVVAAMAAMIVAVVMGAGQIVERWLDPCTHLAAPAGSSDCGASSTSDTTAQTTSAVPQGHTEAP